MNVREKVLHDSQAPARNMQPSTNHAQSTAGQSLPARIRRWTALDFDGEPWPVIAGWFFGIQAALFALSWAVGVVFLPKEAYGLVVTMLAYAGYVSVDAYRAGFRRPRAWGLLVMFGLLPGAIIYARRRWALPADQRHGISRKAGGGRPYWAVSWGVRPPCTG
jgi:hypothetical protein